MSKKISDLPHIPGENPFIVARGGFYRRWIQMIDNIEEFEFTVKQLDTTLQTNWVPVWRQAGRKFEKLGDEAEKAGNFEDARNQYLLAKTHYAIGRFPSEITDVIRVADNNLTMPPKSTWFDPKPLDGLVVYEFD